MTPKKRGLFTGWARGLFMMPRRQIKAASGPVIKRILIRCSVTAKLTDTLEKIEESAFARAKPMQKQFRCAHCGQLHRWTNKDVVLAR